MKSITSLAVIGLLMFACKLCSFSGNTNRPIADPTPTPRPLMYARDFIKTELGPFTLTKIHDKEETRKTASGFTLKLLDQSTDAAAGEYKSASARAVGLLTCAFSNTSTPEALVEEVEKDMRGARGWRTVNNVPVKTGKRVEATDVRGNGIVIWSNGQWLFLTIGNRTSDAVSLANAVGY